MSLIEKTEDFVKEELKNNDSSHDWFHIDRVRNLAKKLAEKTSESVDLEIVELGALLHDIGDWKYTGSETKGRELAEKFLTEQNYDPIKKQKILEIIDGVSFKNELGGIKIPLSLELAIVQDSDRLDALGAIGIARTFAFSGAKKRPMYLPNHDSSKRQKLLSKEEYMNKKEQDDSTIGHFYEKLLHLKDMMKTDAGKKIAEKRHQYMVEFLEEFLCEWSGDK